MPLEQQAKEGIAVWAGVVDPHYQVETNLLFQNGGGLPGIGTLLLLEMSHPWSEWKDTQFSQSLSRVRLFATPWTAARQASLSITNSRSPPKPMSIESGMPSNYLILLPSIFPSIRVFFNESALHIRWSSYWSFSFSISPSSEYSGLISFRMDWLDLLAVQGTLKSLLQHHSSLLPNKKNWRLNRGCLLSPPPWLWGCFKFSQLDAPTCHLKVTERTWNIWRCLWQQQQNQEVSHSCRSCSLTLGYALSCLTSSLLHIFHAWCFSFLLSSMRSQKSFQ